MYNWVWMVTFFIYSSVIVFVIVGGQPTTDDDDDDDDGENQLANAVASLVARVDQLEAEQSARTSDSKLHVH